MQQFFPALNGFLSAHVVLQPLACVPTVKQVLTAVACASAARGEQSILGVDYPELAQQWHPTLNDPHRTPNSYSSFSVWPVWWLCPNSTCTHPHEWRTEVRLCKPLSGCALLLHFGLP